MISDARAFLWELASENPGWNLCELGAHKSSGRKGKERRGTIFDERLFAGKRFSFASLPDKPESTSRMVRSEISDCILTF
jgi:hypothetical protein